MSDNNRKITVDERLNAFEYWVGCQNISETAKATGISRASIVRISEQDGWQARYKKIFDRVLKKQETKIVQKVAENLEYVRTVKKKILLEILDKDNIIKASIHDLVRVMEYEDKLVLRDKGINVDQPVFQFHIHEKILSNYEMPKNDSESIESAEKNIH